MWSFLTTLLLDRPLWPERAHRMMDASCAYVEVTLGLRARVPEWLLISGRGVRRQPLESSEEQLFSSGTLLLQPLVYYCTPLAPHVALLQTVHDMFLVPTGIKIPNRTARRGQPQFYHRWSTNVVQSRKNCPTIISHERGSSSGEWNGWRYGFAFLGLWSIECRSLKHAEKPVDFEELSFIENKFMFLGSWAFWASGTFRHFQPFSENKIRRFQACSGKIRHRHFQGRDFAWSAMTSH